MTNATAKKTVEEIPVTTIVEEMRVTLNISIAEAETLKAILESIGGSTTYSRRKYTGSIYSALETIDDLDSTKAIDAMDSHYNNAIYFKNEKNI